MAQSLGAERTLIPALRLVCVLVLSLLVACVDDKNSFNSLNLSATATLEDESTIAAKVMVVGDVASPRLANLLRIRGYDVTDVPYVVYEATGHTLAGDYIVWTDTRNGDSDIYAYQISTATEFAISLAAGSQLSPQIFGDYVVWEDYRNGNADIYAYRLSTATEFAVTTAVDRQRYPRIDGDYIVWQDERNSEADIYAYQISSGIEMAVSNQPGDGEQWAPQIKGDVIIWQSYQNGFTDIYAYRISTASQSAISVASGSQYMPVLSEKYVVWIDNGSGDDNLYAYNLVTGNTLLVSGSPGLQWRPQVSGEYVVWEDYRNGNADIYAYSFATNSEIPVAVRAKAQVYPVVEGDYIAWQDFRNDNYDIYAYRISSGEEIQISSELTPQKRPLLLDGKIAWLDGRRGLMDVMFRQQVSAADQLATIEWLTPAGIISDLAEQKLVVFGSDFFSDEVMLNAFDAALNLKINVMGLGGTGTSLATALATAGRYGMKTTPASGCSPMRLIADATVNNIHALFTDIDVESILTLELDDAVTMDELAIETDASVAASPADWDMLASFSGRMCNAALPAIVEFSTESGSKVILDGAAGVADMYTYWSAMHWNMFSNAARYLSGTQ